MSLRRWFEDYVFEVTEFVSPEWCDAIIAGAEARGFDEATVNTSKGHIRDAKWRNNDRLISDDGRLAAELWTRAEPCVPRRFKGRDAIGLNERLRFYRYDVGQKFDWHLDGYYERENGERSQYTFMIYLNDGFEGGGTSFADRQRGLFAPFTVMPRKGAALFFYDHLEHRGDEVTAGRKYVLRTDGMYSSRADLNRLP
jgi:hypothetical protein